MSLKEKVAVVTGSSRGIGRAIAESLAKTGCKVVVTGTKGAGETASEIESNGGTVLNLSVDVRSPESIDQMMKSIHDQFGQLDILVSNAGVTKDGLLMRMKEEDWDCVLETNLKGAFYCCKAACRPLMKSPAGRIILISSVIGLKGNPGQVNYAASKAGLIGLTKTLAKELGSRKVTVNAIAPGFIETDMTKGLTEKMIDDVLSDIPLSRLGQGSDIAAAVEFLASEEAGYITGHVLNVDGGLAM